MGIAERKQREHERRERDILGAALRLFEGDDWQDVTIDRIAHEAEIGKGTVYLHFASKEDIYGRLALEFTGHLLTELRRIDPEQPVLEQLRQAIRLFFAAHQKGRRYQRIVEYCARDDFWRRAEPGLRGELQELEGQIAALIHAILQRGIEEGVFPDRPTSVLLYGAHSALIGAVRLLWNDCLGGPTPADPVEEITRFVLAGLMYQGRVEAAPSRPPARRGASRDSGAEPHGTSTASENDSSTPA